MMTRGKNMKILEIKEKIRSLKRSYKKIDTNFYPGTADDEQEADVFENEKALVFVIQEPNRRRVFFVSADETDLSKLLLKIPKGSVLEYICRDEKNPLENVFANSGVVLYKTYIRRTICYSDNPYDLPETGRRKLLKELYDPACGEYADEKDVCDLFELTKETFDPLCDDVFTVEQWEDIVAKKQCLLYRENGEIISYYVFRQEGKKLYSNISLNRGPANYLYNLERRVFEEMWAKGIRIFYAWFHIENSKALRRKNENDEKYTKSKEIIFNFIYMKK